MGLIASPEARAAALQYKREARRLQRRAKRAMAENQPVYAEYLERLAKRCINAARAETRPPTELP